MNFKVVELFYILNLNQSNFRDLMAIVSALEYNTFFRGLKVSNVRLSHETLERILHVLRRSMWLEELHLEALGLRWIKITKIQWMNLFLNLLTIYCRADFLHKLAVSVITNNNPALQTIDLSHNLIEDKGKMRQFFFTFCKRFANTFFAIV